MCNNVFYGVVGNSGYGVFDSFEKIMGKLKYIHNIEVKQNACFEGARSWARDTYYKTRPRADEFFVDEVDSVNWMNHRKPYQRGIVYDVE